MKFPQKVWIPLKLNGTGTVAWLLAKFWENGQRLINSSDPILTMTFQRNLTILALALLFGSPIHADTPGFSIEGATPPPKAVPQKNPLISRVAFGSCSKEDKPQPILRKIVEMKPELFIYLGDNVYGDSRDPNVLRQKYSKLGVKDEFQALRRAMPVIATWDDHDYGENDAGREYPLKEKSKEIFLDFWNEPKPSPRRDRPGIHTSHLFTDDKLGKTLQVIILDTRTFRSPLTKAEGKPWKNDYRPHEKPGGTILGDDQWKWLEEQLKQKADLRIICSSIQFSHQYNGWESWTNFPFQRQKMVDLISDTKANGVVFISGDVHWAEISELKTDNCYPLYDVTASGLTEDWDKLEPNNNRIGEAYMDNNFGMIEVDWSTTDPVVTLTTRDITGKVRAQKSFPASTISFPKS